MMCINILREATQKKQSIAQKLTNKLKGVLETVISKRKNQSTIQQNTEKNRKKISIPKSNHTIKHSIFVYGGRQRSN